MGTGNPRSLVEWSTRMSIFCNRGRSYCGGKGEIELSLVETPPVSAARWHGEEFRDPGTRAMLHAVMENRWAASSWRMETQVGVSWRGRRSVAPLVRKRVVDQSLGRLGNGPRVLINPCPPPPPSCFTQTPKCGSNLIFLGVASALGGVLAEGCVPFDP